LRSDIEELIASHEQAEEFIESPASDLAAGWLARGRSGLKPGEKIGPYEVQSVLGIGGMGEVYLALDTRLSRQVALKLLPSRFTSDPERVRRFEQEVRAASALNHPNFVTIHEIGKVNSTQFMVTEFVQGQTLRQLMNEKPFTLNEALNVAIQVSSALAGAHSAGIVHRDIKPENIMLRGDGYVKILDFGLAKLTETQPLDSDPETPTLVQSSPGLVMGTVQYMSPEQARGKKVDARTDIWSLGVVLYELLARRVPFSGETPSHVMVSLMEDELPGLTSFANVPAELDRIVTSLLQYARPRVPELKPSALAACIEHVLQLAADPVERAGVRVELDVAPRLGPVYIDADLATQVLLNVTLNAVQAMPQGGRLRYEVRRVRRRGPPRGAGRRASDRERRAGREGQRPWSFFQQVRVIDTGVGISRGVLAKLFDPFFSTKPGGTGLGLSICQTIMHEHGGSITVASREGRGTTVLLDFPVEKRHGERRRTDADAKRTRPAHR